MATKTSEKVLITGMCLLTTLNLATHYQNEKREIARAEADARREQRVTLRKTCMTATRQMHRLAHQLRHMRDMSPYSQEFKTAFEKLGRIARDIGDKGDEGGKIKNDGGK
ncbi:uncharacterized protein F4817DRAFT_317650 [Daldinia loculata]|uniref:uncharacterized protein n=1 Tax=Daldinia loculata TaxID=103429 RepID=UPI0020C2C048|nr:uncharacterized protein F4817DRAFT_317650 [Daldinia loculata]KAI1645599.1 hypothetical protein F4817DRAFT_317650 [Daldinia loculata]